MKLLYSNYLGDYITDLGGLRINFSLQLQFPCSFNDIQLQEIIPLSDFQSFFAITVTRINGFEFKM